MPVTTKNTWGTVARAAAGLAFLAATGCLVSAVAWTVWLQTRMLWQILAAHPFPGVPILVFAAVFAVPLAVCTKLGGGE